jgi:phosphohistidine swiveling domain-containing protein
MKLSTDSYLERARHGGKACGLQQLLRAGGRVPPTFVLEAGTYSSPDLSNWLHQCDASEFLVRSSAPEEDGFERSGAGAYLSLRVALDLVHASIAQVATQGEAASGRPIAVLIQPALDGPGGVYLRDLSADAESLRIALSGPSGITSGAALPPDLLMSDSPEAVLALRDCRLMAGTLGGAVDLEFVIVQGSMMWLQYRPLLAHIPTQSAGLSEHFPSALPPLCGTLWADVLQREYGEGVEFDGSYIVGLSDDGDDVIETGGPSHSELRAAERYYYGVLFPRWRELCNGLRTTRSEPVGDFLRVIEAWRTFWHDYLSNPHETVVRRARRAAGAEAGMSPSVREHMSRLYRARSELSQAEMNAGHISPAVALYVEDYGYLPLAGNDFSQPTLRELPETCLRQIFAANPPPKRLGTVPLLHQVAWLTEEDNFYKWRLAAHVRYSILYLGEFLRAQGTCSSADAIWSVTLEDLLRSFEHPDQPLFNFSEAVPGEASAPERRITVPTTYPTNRSHGAAVLAPGTASARAANTDNFQPGDVLFSVALDASDYGLLSIASAAVVALGGLDSHVALFARELGIPLFRCPEAVRTIRPGDRAILGNSPPSVTLLAGSEAQ